MICMGASHRQRTGERKRLKRNLSLIFIFIANKPHSSGLIAAALCQTCSRESDPQGRMLFKISCWLTIIPHACALVVLQQLSFKQLSLSKQHLQDTWAFQYLNVWLMDLS